jgi:hypothetical protein
MAGGGGLAGVDMSVKRQKKNSTKIFYPMTTLENQVSLKN